jgi:Bacterial Ig-like domain (group 1)/PKD domain
MVTQRRVMLFALLAPFALVTACDKVPLLAPTGSVITLIPATTTVPLNSEVTIVATVIENGVASSSGTGPTSSTSTSRTGNGTPVQNGTVVTFTTTIGRIEPSEARTHNGEVTVKLITGGTSGTATITAYSGGASAQITNLKVGTAAAKTVTLTSTPQTLGSSGGSVAVQATVSDEGGSPVAGIPVTFSTVKGSVSPSTASTDANGVATATLTTTATTEVTATIVGTTTSGKSTVTVSAFGLTSFSASTVNPVAGQAVAFNVQPNTNASLQNVRVDFGDGNSVNLGPISTATFANNVYCSPGNYTATATATDNSGGTGSLSSNVIVGALPVTLTGSGTTVSSPTNFSVTGTGNAQVAHYTWTFDDGTASFDTGGPSTSHTFVTRGLKTVRVDVLGVGCGKIGTATTTIDIQ